MNAFRPKPIYFPLPFILYALAILAAFRLADFHPLNLQVLPHLLSLFLGTVFVGLAITMQIWAIVTLLNNHAPFFTNRYPARLITEGPFQWTRNPVYLGYTLLVVGLGLISSNAWFIIMAMLAGLLTQGFAIYREELHLLSRFGIEFEIYCQKTRRWI